jgi:hypothetical protein
MIFNQSLQMKASYNKLHSHHNRFIKLLHQKMNLDQLNYFRVDIQVICKLMLHNHIYNHNWFNNHLKYHNNHHN